MSRRHKIDILLLTLIVLGLFEVTPAQYHTDELRSTMQSLIISYNQLDHKLERHENRERVLGEMMKKGMISLQKSQKGLEPLNGIFARLDDRVNQIETMLITQEEKYNTQADKFSQTLEQMFKWMHENDECMRRPPIVPAIAAPAPSAGIPDEFILQQQKINQQLLSEIQKLSQNVAKLLDNSRDMMAQSEVAFRSMPSTAEKLTKIEDTLVSYTIAPPVTVAPVDNSEFENKVLEKFDKLGVGLAALKSAPKPNEGLSVKDKEFIHSLANETLSALTVYKTETLSATERALTKTTDQLQQNESNLENSLKKVTDELKDSSTQLLEDFYKQVNNTYNKLNKGFELLEEINAMMRNSSENELETQRKVEYAQLQIVLKVSQLLEKNDEELRLLLKARFDNVDEGVLNTALEGAKNLSGMLESELAQVWRRIEIMNSELANSNELLKFMHTEHEGYINSTATTMSNLASKVEQTKNRMLDMDSNLNYLLGKLSVMSTEFANIKTGLAQSLEELRNTFHTMQERIPSAGVSNADKDKYVTLLSKRQTQPN